jgi:hypothetical protein
LGQRDYDSAKSRLRRQNFNPIHTAAAAISAINTTAAQNTGLSSRRFAPKNVASATV